MWPRTKVVRLPCKAVVCKLVQATCTELAVLGVFGPVCKLGELQSWQCWEYSGLRASLASCTKR